MSTKIQICGEFHSLSTEKQESILNWIKKNFKKGDTFNKDCNSKYLLEMYVFTKLCVQEDDETTENVIKCAMIKSGYVPKVISDEVHVYEIDIIPGDSW